MEGTNFLLNDYLEINSDNNDVYCRAICSVKKTIDIAIAFQEWLRQNRKIKIIHYNTLTNEHSSLLTEKEMWLFNIFIKEYYTNVKEEEEIMVNKLEYNELIEKYNKQVKDTHIQFGLMSDEVFRLKKLAKEL